MWANSLSVFRNSNDKIKNKLAITCSVWAMCFFTLGCAKNFNLFTEMSDKTTDEAIYYDAKVAVSKGNWTTAITKISRLTAGYQAHREVQVLLASAYVGRCGLDVLALADSLQNAGTNSFFGLLFTAFSGATATNVADCETAETTLKNVWGTPNPSSGNPVNENVLMAFIGLAKIGAILNADGDLDKNNVVDWTIATTNHPCDNSGAGDTALPVADVNQIITGFALAMQSLIAAGSTTPSLLAAAVTACQASSLSGQALGAVCTATTTTGIAGTDRQNMRALIEEDVSKVGLAIRSGSSFATSLVACPNTN